ncbi:ATP-binding protein [Methanobrevibacter sp.]|uniref:ATP-binding protein n=1 Tax=Methanobrevibacter sp. TaxID=66852 RepID=UPI00388D9B1F
MKNELYNHIKKLNSIDRIKDKNDLKLNNSIYLPQLEHLRRNNFISQKEIDKILKNPDEIKKLKFYNFIDFINISDKIESYLSELTDEISKILPKNVDIQGMDFLLYEILINIYKHSKFENAYLQFNIENNERIIEIYILDDGIGIPGSFRDASFNYDNDNEVIFDAINGKTTDKEKYNLHGRGLNSSARITTLGFDGEMLIASGNGICLINKKGAETYDNKNKIIGTFIILRINNKKIENIYEYLKYEKINKITGVNHE